MGCLDTSTLSREIPAFENLVLIARVKSNPPPQKPSNMADSQTAPQQVASSRKTRTPRPPFEPALPQERAVPPTLSKQDLQV